MIGDKVDLSDAVDGLLMIVLIRPGNQGGLFGLKTMRFMYGLCSGIPIISAQDWDGYLP